MQDSPSHRDAPEAPAPEVLRAAFRELHGARLHGFALLVTLGDRALAARLCATALAEGSRRTDELRHPERAAAWLRARIVRSIPRRARTTAAAERRAALEELDVDDTVIVGLEALRPIERAALVATAVERLDRRDVEVVVGRDEARLDRLLVRARSEFASAVAKHPPPVSFEEGQGPILSRVRATAARALR